MMSVSAVAPDNEPGDEAAYENEHDHAAYDPAGYCSDVGARAAGGAGGVRCQRG